MLYCDKWVGVRSAAEAAATEVFRKMNRHAVKANLPSELPAKPDWIRPDFVNVLCYVFAAI